MHITLLTSLYKNPRTMFIFSVSRFTSKTIMKVIVCYATEYQEYVFCILRCVHVYERLHNLMSSLIAWKFYGRRVSTAVHVYWVRVTVKIGFDTWGRICACYRSFDSYHEVGRECHMCIRFRKFRTMLDKSHQNSIDS